MAIRRKMFLLIARRLAVELKLCSAASSTLTLKWLLRIKHEDNSFYPDDAPVGRRIGAAKTNYELRAGQRTQNVLRSPWKRRSRGVAPRLVHDNFKQLDWVDRRTFQNA